MTESFTYVNGILHAEQVDVARIAAEVGTPCYIYSAERLRHNYKEFRDAFAGMDIHIHYANKANPNLAVTRVLAACGAGADITSGGELERALAAGIKGQNIIYSGVGKTEVEIAAALKADIYQFNVESMPELHAINKVAAQMGKKTAVTLRVNPDVSARTYKKTSTGELGTKCGIDMVQLEEAMALFKTLPALDFKGFQVHIGSHVYDYEPFREAFLKLAELTHAWRARGYTVERLDLGGGVGIPYDGQSLAPFADYARTVRETVGNLGCQIAFEPGRRLVGDAGILLSRVTYDKQGHSNRFLILDAGMNDLIRPAMYEARHSIIPVKQSGAEQTALADIVGPVCETSDLFGVDYRLPGVGTGDLVAILQAGAYGAAMASTYNGRALIPEVMVSGNQYAVVRRRIAIQEQIDWESVPDWANVATH
ncbi:MAG: diaminopimelate decarboxylase [Alphaproteobacteria bacterium]|nr:diaminopimelate decarboxylase [Alphaproteobacteria bacterium]